MPVTYTWEQVKQKLTQKYPTLDFSKSQYINNKTKIIFTCPEHGEFTKSPSKMLGKGEHGCTFCAKKKQHLDHRISVDRVKELVYDSHGDSITVPDHHGFCGTGKKMIFTCHIHGDFITTASTVIYGGGGCQKCGKLRYLENHPKRKDQDYFDAKMRELHAGSLNLDFSNSKYTTSTRNTTVLCKIHGEFFITPASLYRGKGCPACSIDKRSRTRVANASDKIKDRIRAIHGDKYDLSYVKYEGSQKNIILVCPEHGIFERRPSNLIHGRKTGCPYCAGKYVCNNEVQKRIDAVHGEGRYTCEEVISSTLPFRVTCNVCGNVWDAKHIGDMTRGYGRCLACFPPVGAGFDHEKSSILYNIKFTLADGTICYKVGITNTTVEERLVRMGVNQAVSFEILDYIEYDKGEDAYQQEQALHRQYKDCQYKGEKFLESGWTEIFTVNPFTDVIRSQSN